MYRCVAFIEGDALLHNLAILQKVSASKKVIMMVKANAYGHGLKEVALLLKDEPIAFGVAAIDEALILREASIKNQIILFDGGASSDQSDLLVSQDITPVLTDMRGIESLERSLKKAGLNKKKVHLKIDSGFMRLGLCHQKILDGSFDDLLDRLKNSDLLELEGVATHFCKTDEYIDVQIERFQNATAYMINRGLRFEYLHMANSAAILTKRSSFARFNKSFYIRPGLSAYGLDPMRVESHFDLRPVMSIKAQVVAIKELMPGQGVGYGHSFIANEPKRVAVITMGYGDGLRRSLSDQGYMLVRGQKAFIIGTISMDSCTIDISHIDGVNPGDMVTVLGQDGDLSITAWDIARLTDTIPYEVLTSISARLTRAIK